MRRWRARAGLDIVFVAGDPALEKLTYEADFERAETARLSLRVGFGFDVHALAAGEDLWLGGIQIPHAKGLRGHSDADVVLHALTDAILGALGAGDIGDHFPPSDPQWRGAASSLFLEHAARLVAQAGGRIDHVDVTIVCEAPRIGPHRDAMRARIAGLLRLPRRGLASRRRRPSGWASPAAAKASPRRRWRRCACRRIDDRDLRLSSCPPS